MRLAVIDLGSNSTRIGVYEKINDVVTEIQKKRLNTRLAEGLEKDNLLKDEPVKRTVEALKDFKNIIRNNQCDKVIAVATESLRRAKNADSFIKTVKTETGINVNVIDGKEESFYGAMAAKSVTFYKSFYSLDVGGGSFELSKVKDGKVTDFVCLPYGCVVLTEEFTPDTNSPIQLELFLNKIFNDISFIDEKLPLVLLGGSAKEIAKYVYKDSKLTDFDGKTAKTIDALDLYNLLKKTPVSERITKFQMEERRADIIVAGLATIVALIKKSSSKDMVFCMKSIRDGIAYSELLKQEF